MNPAPVLDLDIQSQPLDEALQQLARATGVQILFFSQLTRDRRAPQLTGPYTLAAAMEHLLSGSGLQFRFINAHTVEVRQGPSSPSRSSGSLVAQPSRPSSAGADDSTPAEVLILGSAEQLVATRVPTPLREIPQSIFIVSREQIRQQSGGELVDVLRRSAGMTTRQETSTNVSFYSRGFKVLSYNVDGGAGYNPRFMNERSVSFTPDLSQFDHIEVLRGSDALFAGNATPGGTISLVRKRPLQTYQADVSAIYGSWNNRRLEIDLTGPLAAQGAVRGRMDATYLSTDYFYDTANLTRKRLFGVLERGPRTGRHAHGRGQLSARRQPAVVGRHPELPGWRRACLPAQQIAHLRVGISANASE